MNEMKCRRCGANENRIHGFCSMECETAWYYEDDIRDLTARIAELESERRWIPVSERLPEEDKLVLFYDNFIEEIRKGWLSNNQWTSDESIYYNCDRFNRITHWRLLPQLPEVEE